MFASAMFHGMCHLSLLCLVTPVLTVIHAVVCIDFLGVVFSFQLIFHVIEGNIIISLNLKMSVACQ
jgi:hypothetical protein